MTDGTKGIYVVSDSFQYNSAWHAEKLSSLREQHKKYSGVESRLTDYSSLANLKG